jgi:hypothetical protein
MMTSDARHTSEIKYVITKAKTETKKTKTLFTVKLDLNFRKELVRCCIWNIAFYGVETWTLRKVNQKYIRDGAREGGRRSFGPIG